MCYIEYCAQLRISYYHAVQLEKAKPKYFLILRILLLAIFLDCKAKAINVYLHFEMFGEMFYKSEGDFIMSHKKISIKTLHMCVRMCAHVRTCKIFYNQNKMACSGQTSVCH